MTFRVSGKNIAVGEALRERVNQRIAEATTKYFDGGFSGHVTIGKEGFGFRTECVIHLDSGIVLEAEAMAPDAYASAEQAADRIEKRLRRYKRRLKDHPLRPGRRRCEAETIPSRGAELCHRRAGARQRREASPTANPVIIAEIDDHVETPESVERSRDGTRHDRHHRGGVPARWTRPRQSGLPPRATVILAGSIRPHRRQGRPLTALESLLMVRRLWSVQDIGSRVSA